MFREYFQIAEYRATTSNNYHGEKPGTVVDGMTGNLNVSVSADPDSGYPNSAPFTILDPDGEVLADDVTLYWSQANNVTLCIKITDQKWILLSLSVKSGEKNVVQLTDEAMELIREEVSKAAQIDRIEDEMGDYIEYKNTVACDGTTSYEENNSTLAWRPTLKKNPETTETGAGENITKWSHNVAELIYRVHLKVEQDDFNSCADNMNSELGDKETYAVNKRATLYYDEDKTAEFPVPHVRGLLYDIEFTKQDEEGKALNGAEFSVSGNYFDETITRTATSAADGSVKIKNIPWGTYTLSETKVPDGYRSEYTGESVTLCYTTNKDLLGLNHSEDHDSDETTDITRLLYKGEISDNNIIVNIKDTVSVFVRKQWKLPGDNYTHPDDVTVQLIATVDGKEYELPEEVRDEIELSDDNNWKYNFTDLPIKNDEGKEIEYSVTETMIGEVSVSNSSYDSKVTENTENSFTITNTLIDFWNIRKVSSTDERIGLEGALFTLTDTKTGEVYYGKSYENGLYEGVVKWFEKEEDVDHFDKALRYIPDGTYILEEKIAPDGYIKNDVKWTIVVDNLQLLVLVYK